MDFGTIWNAVQPEVIIVALAAAFSGATYAYQWGVQRLPASMRAHINDLAQTAVQAIEQKYQNGSPGGALKKQEAMRLLLSLCQSLKLPIDTAHASAAIEAAVFALNLLEPSTTQQPAVPTTEKPTAPMKAVSVTAKSKPLAAG